LTSGHLRFQREAAVGTDIVFSEKAYKEFLNQKQFISNTRIRPEDESIWDVLLSEQADFTRMPGGDRILEVIKGLGE
jgi:hypothetical protein